MPLLLVQAMLLGIPSLRRVKLIIIACLLPGFSGENTFLLGKIALHQCLRCEETASIMACASAFRQAPAGLQGASVKASRPTGNPDCFFSRLQFIHGRKVLNRGSAAQQTPDQATDGISFSPFQKQHIHPAPSCTHC